MSKIKYQATDSRGQVHTRTTTHRVYTHVVVAHVAAYPAGTNKYGVAYLGDEACDYVEWAGRLELAHNVARRWQREQARTDRHAAVESVEILEVERVR